MIIRGVQSPAAVRGDLVLRPKQPGATLTQWLYEELRRAILDGRVGKGAKLPPTRDVASQYGISRRIVVNAFEQLKDEGYLDSKVGFGTTVSDNIPEDFVIAPKSRKPKTNHQFDEEAVHSRRPVRAFRPIEPALSEFPIDVWARVAGRCIRRMSTATLAGGDTAGYRPLREAIAAYLGSSRGVACSADHIVVTSGTQQSLDLIARLLVRPRDPVWMEDPGYSGAVDAFRLAGAKIVPVRVDDYGIDADCGRLFSPHPRAIYLTPAHQFPLGVTLRLDRKLDLLQWSRKNNVWVIEDDYDSEFRFGGKPVPAMKGLHGAEQVFLLGTFNKTLFPSLRLGYMVVPDAWVDPVNRFRRQLDRHPPSMSQAVLAAFIEEGHFGKHLRRMHELYGARLDALHGDAQKYLKGIVRLPEIQAGLNIPAFLLNGLTSQQAFDRAAAAHVETWPLDRFAIARRDLHGLVLGFAAFTEREIRQGVVALAKALAS